MKFPAYGLSSDFQFLGYRRKLEGETFFWFFFSKNSHIQFFFFFFHFIGPNYEGVSDLVGGSNQATTGYGLKALEMLSRGYPPDFCIFPPLKES